MFHSRLDKLVEEPLGRLCFDGFAINLKRIIIVVLLEPHVEECATFPAATDGDELWTAAPTAGATSISKSLHGARLLRQAVNDRIRTARTVHCTWFPLADVRTM